MSNIRPVKAPARSIVRLARYRRPSALSHSVCKGREGGRGLSSGTIAALSKFAGLRGGIDEGVRVLIGTDSPWVSCLVIDPRNPLPDIHLGQMLATRQTTFKTN